VLQPDTISDAPHVGVCVTLVVPCVYQLQLLNTYCPCLYICLCVCLRAGCLPPHLLVCTADFQPSCVSGLSSQEISWLAGSLRPSVTPTLSVLLHSVVCCCSVPFWFVPWDPHATPIQKKQTFPTLHYKARQRRAKMLFCHVIVDDNSENMPYYR